MRINKFLARAAGVSRRQADALIRQGQAKIAGRTANLGDNVDEASQAVTLNDQSVVISTPNLYLLLHKPAGYVCSRRRQGEAPTIYELLPKEYQELKPVGRLDKDSTGLLLLTNDGELHQRLTHPAFQKEKIYQVELDKPLTTADKTKLEQGIQLDDYISRLRLAKTDNHTWVVTMNEGRNRQIRRTFSALGYEVKSLHRSDFGPFQLELKSGQYREVDLPPDLKQR